MDRVNRHDVGVLELGERPRFAEKVGDGLQDDQAIGQLALPGQVDAAERAAPQLGEQTEADQLAADPGHRRHGQGQALRDDGVGAMQLVEDRGVILAPLEAVAERLAVRTILTGLAFTPFPKGQGRLRHQGRVEEGIRFLRALRQPDRVRGIAGRASRWGARPG